MTVRLLRSPRLETLVNPRQSTDSGKSTLRIQGDKMGHCVSNLITGSKCDYKESTINSPIPVALPILGLVPHRMGLLLPVVLCALAACCGATSPPLSPLRYWPPIIRSCNDSGILELAGFALQDINRDRKDGYVLSLNRVSDVREHRQASDSPLSRACACTS